MFIKEYWYIRERGREGVCVRHKSKRERKDNMLDKDFSCTMANNGARVCVERIDR